MLKIFVNLKRISMRMNAVKIRSAAMKVKRFEKESGLSKAFVPVSIMGDARRIDASSTTRSRAGIAISGI